MAEQTERSGCIGCVFLLAALDGGLLYALDHWFGVAVPGWVWWVDAGALAILGLAALLEDQLAGGSSEKDQPGTEGQQVPGDGRGGGLDHEDE